MVLAIPNTLILSRKSLIWLGSRPAVGSSMISTSGSCNSAWASPTRCRYPLDSLPIGFSHTSLMAHWSATTVSRSSSRSPANPLISPKKPSNSAGVMSL